MKLPTLVVMGVSGCGKSTVGAMLARTMQREFIDADDLHSDENLRRMAASIPLDDEHRWPWLGSVARVIGRWEEAGEYGIVACSALKRSYRDCIRRESGTQPLFVHLATGEEELARRLARRAGHFMPPMLLASQLEALERPAADELAISLHENLAAAEICALILSRADSLVTAFADYQRQSGTDHTKRDRK